MGKKYTLPPVRICRLGVRICRHPAQKGFWEGGGERKIIGESQRIRRAWRGRMNDLLPLFVQFTALVPSVSSVVNPS